MLRVFFFLLPLLNVEVGDLEYPPTPSHARILDEVLIDTDPSRRLKKLVRFCFQIFSLRHMDINKQLGTIMYLLLQASLVQAQVHHLDQDAIGKIMNNSEFSANLLKLRIAGCNIECPNAIHWGVCTKQDITTLIEDAGDGIKMITKFNNKSECLNLSE